MISKLNKKYSIFISSTYEDMKLYRQSVHDAVLKDGNFPIAMENFIASNKSQWDVIKQLIKECDYYLLIVGFRYGSIDPESKISYTQKEYEYALSNGKPILSFFIDESFDTIKDDDLTNINLFKEKIKTNGKLSKFCTNKNNLSSDIISALHSEMKSSEQSGWIRADAFNSLQNKYNKLQNEYNLLLNPTNFDDCMSLDEKIELYGYMDNFNPWYKNDIYKNIFITIAHQIFDYFPEDFLFTLITRSIDFPNQIPEYSITLDESSKIKIRNKFKQLNLISFDDITHKGKTTILWKLTEKGKNYFYHHEDNK